MFRTLIALPLAAVVFAAGCARETTPPAAPPAVVKADEHGHKPAAHGGILVSIGSDSYHAEAVFEKGGKLRLYMLGKDESRILEIDAQPLTAYVKAAGDAEAEAVVLRPAPAAGDAKGKTSQFLGQLPAALTGRKLDVTIPNVRINDERFRIAFQSTAGGDEHGMPAAVADDDARKLYLTPGGKYTKADIAANGGKTAAEKFKGAKPEHDLHPKAGDKICPITLTKANTKFTWVVDGKTYEFCCHPCIDEFVGLAKEKPDEVKEPDFYRKK